MTDSTKEHDWKYCCHKHDVDTTVYTWRCSYCRRVINTYTIGSVGSHASDSYKPTTYDLKRFGVTLDCTYEMFAAIHDS